MGMQSKSYAKGEFTLSDQLDEQTAEYLELNGIVLADAFNQTWPHENLPAILGLAIEAFQTVLGEIQKPTQQRNMPKLVNTFNALQNAVYLAENKHPEPMDIVIMSPESIQTAKALRNLTIGVLDPSQFRDVPLTEGEDPETFKNKIIEAWHADDFIMLNIAVKDFQPV